MARINAAGLALVKAHEGLRLQAYQDGGGVWTIGYGHTQGVKPGDVICPTKAELLLEADLQESERAVDAQVRERLTPNQFAALVDFVFNEGSEALARSTLLKTLNKGGQALVPVFLKAWVLDNGKVAPGLMKRRAAKAALWSEA